MSVLTAEEQGAPFSADISDEAAGRWLKDVEQQFVGMLKKHGEEVEEIDANHCATLGATGSASLFLVRHAIASRADRFQSELSGVTIDGEERGDWVITVERKSAEDD